MKPLIRFQRNIFWENDDQHLEIIKKYFDEVVIDPNNLPPEHDHSHCFQNRVSLALAQKFKCLEKFTNALEWAGKLRKEMLDSDFYFSDMNHVLDSLSRFPRPIWYDRNIASPRKLFIRPASGMKTFAGNVYNYDSFKNEVDFLVQKNVDPRTVMCLVSDVRHIHDEYRTIFIDGEYVSGSKYMAEGELAVDSNVPDDIIKYAKKVHKKYDLPPWIVLDVCYVSGYSDMRVIELNQIETSSFYAADLDSIYYNWKKAL